MHCSVLIKVLVYLGIWSGGCFETDPRKSLLLCEGYMTAATKLKSIIVLVFVGGNGFLFLVILFNRRWIFDWFCKLFGLECVLPE